MIFTVLDDSKDQDQRAAELRIALTDLYDTSRAGGVDIAVIVLGDPVERAMNKTVSAEPTSALRTTLTDLGVHWLDARSWLSDDKSQEPLPKIPGDGHLTPLGNRIAAQRVATWLTDMRLVPTG